MRSHYFHTRREVRAFESYLLAKTNKCWQVESGAFEHRGNTFTFRVRVR